MALLLIIFILVTLGVLFLLEKQLGMSRLRDKSVLWIFFGMVISLAVMIWEHVITDPGIDILAIIGSVIFLIGVVIRILARRTLGNFFTYEVMVTKSHRLVTTGIYTYIRHPCYLGIFLLWLGAALILQSRIGLVLVILLLVPALWYRILVEEALLQKAFGKKYSEYMLRTKRIIPFVF
ncbi:MAG: isoprenylcysteine carboxylmethyltransferase family protein [Nanoarchaeota archaeon]